MTDRSATPDPGPHFCDVYQSFGIPLKASAHMPEPAVVAHLLNQALWDDCAKWRKKPT